MNNHTLACGNHPKGFNKMCADCALVTVASERDRYRGALEEIAELEHKGEGVLMVVGEKARKVLDEYRYTSPKEPK